MARTSQTAEEIPSRTEPMEIGPDLSPGFLAAFDGLYYIFGARFDGYDIVDNGIVVHNVTFDGGHNPDQILRDVNRRNRRTPLMPTLRWLNGEVPAPFGKSTELNTYLSQFFKGGTGAENSTRTPAYAKDAVAAFRARSGNVGGKRGPKPKVLQLKNLGSVDVSTLTAAGAKPEDLEHLIQVAQQALQSQASGEITSPAS